MKAVILGFAVGLAVGLANASRADDMVAAEQLSGTSVGFVLRDSYSNATLTIAGPDGFYASTFSKGGAVAIDMSRHGPLVDGTYKYQLTAAGKAKTAVRKGLADGRGSGRGAVARTPASKSGAFGIKGGQIVDAGTSGRSSTSDQDSR